MLRSALLAAGVLEVLQCPVQCLAILSSQSRVSADWMHQAPCCCGNHCLCFAYGLNSMPIIALIRGPVPSAYAALDCMLVVLCSYSKLTEEEVKLDRYAKFRALGQFEEHLVPGGQWRETRAARAKVGALLCMLLYVSPVFMMLSCLSSKHRLNCLQVCHNHTGQIVTSCSMLLLHK